MEEKIKNYIQQNLYLIILVIASLIYIARGLVTIEETGKSIVEVFADGAISSLFGYFIGRILGLYGLQRGENNENYKATCKLFSQIVERISHKINQLDKWCYEKYDATLKIERIKILNNVGVTYEEFIDRKIFKEKYKMKAIKKARKLKITPFCASVLTNDGGKINDPFNFGQSKQAFMVKSSVKMFISKIGCGLCFGYFGVSFVKLDVAAIIWTFVQVGFFLLMGVSSYATNYYFITDTMRDKKIMKIDMLEKFDAETKNKEGIYE